MESADDSYIAWDGSRYPGSPPAGWYLAVDNRWWPPQDLIDDSGPGMATSYDAATPDVDRSSTPPTPDPRPLDPAFGSAPTTPSTSTPTSPSRPSTPPELETAPPSRPSQDWAPESYDDTRSRRREPTSAGTGPPRPTARSRRRRRNERTIRSNPFFFLLLMFGLFRCASADFSQVEEATDVDISIEEGFDTDGLDQEIAEDTTLPNELQPNDAARLIESLGTVERIANGTSVGGLCGDGVLRTALVDIEPSVAATYEATFVVSNDTSSVPAQRVEIAYVVADDLEEGTTILVDEPLENMPSPCTVDLILVTVEPADG
jgi:hypothetical protein